MLRRFAVIVVACVFATLGALVPSAQQPKKRVALVIGNDAYTGGDANPKGLAKLANPARDARAVAALLKQHGFEVIDDYDLDRDRFERLLARFARATSGADTALVFYAGHGMEVLEKDDLTNVLAPIDAEIDCDTREHFKTVKLEAITRAIRGVPNQVVILDACRNNPFPKCPVKRGDQTRSFGFRAADLTARRGEAILLTYSTAQKSFAIDGNPGEHSPFAKELLASLADNPHANFFPLMTRLVVNVGSATKFDQVPSVTIEGGIPLTCLAGVGCSNSVEDIQAQRDRVRLLANNAAQHIERGYPVEAMLLALEALPDDKAGVKTPYEPVAEANLYKAHGARRERITLRDHTATVTTAAFSSDGKLVVTASSDGTGRLWDVSFGAERATLEGHSASVFSAAFSPDSRLIVTASFDVTARLWDTGSGTELASLKGHTFGVASAAFSPDGRSVLTTSWDGTVRLWDAGTGVARATLKAYRGPSRAAALPELAAFSPDGKLLVTGSEDGTARLWNTGSGTEHATLQGHTRAVTSVAFSPDGKVVATASGDNTVRLWDVASGAESATFKGHTGWFRSAAFSPDGALIVAASDHAARLWDAASGAERATLIGHTGTVTSAAFSPDGKLVLTASEDGTARLWEPRSSAPGANWRERVTLRGHSGPIRSAAFSPDSKLILTVSSDGTVKLWDRITAAEHGTVTGRMDAYAGVALSPDRTLVVTGSRDGEARLWDAASGAERAIVKGKAFQPSFSPDGKLILAYSDKTARLWDSASGAERVIFSGHTEAVTGSAFSPDGKLIITRSYDNTVRLWDPASGAERISLKAGPVNHSAFSPDGKLLVTVGVWNNTAELWDIASGSQRATLTGHDYHITGVAFSPVGKLVVTGSGDNTVRLWDAFSGTERRIFKGHTKGLRSVAFSPDGNLIVSASEDNTARLWDVESGAERAVLKGHTNAVVRAAFSPDGKSIVTGSWDKTARLWDAASGAERATLSGHTAAVDSAAFSRDGKLVITGSTDKTWRLWDVHTTQDLVEAAKVAVPRCLTKEQRAEFGLPPEPPKWCAEMGKWPYARANAAAPPTSAKTEPSAEEWMNQWIASKRARAAVGALHLARFKDPTYVLTQPIGWKPNAEQAARLKAIEVPKGFVTDFASIPRIFWSALRPDGDYAYAAIIHDWLYWSQATNKDVADEIFRHAMLDFKIDAKIAGTIYQAVRLAGDSAWKKNAEAKAKGEKRVLKTLPDDPRITWTEWKAKAGVFE